MQPLHIPRVIEAASHGSHGYLDSPFGGIGGTAVLADALAPKAAKLY